jgi:hypothetical protein
MSGQTDGEVARNAPHPWPPGLPPFIDHSAGTEEISIEAMSLVGVPYRWGGNTPDSGFDCSGLVSYVVRRAALVNLPRTTEQMGNVGVSISTDEISPGDLIFFNTTGRAHSHVGIYVGQYRFVNAPKTGGAVRIDYVTNPYWAQRFDGIRRITANPPNRPVNSAPLEADLAASHDGSLTKTPNLITAAPNRQDGSSMQSDPIAKMTHLPNATASAISSAMPAPPPAMHVNPLADDPIGAFATGSQ